MQSVLYDALSLVLSRRADTILLLGVSGAVALPLMRLISRARLLVHVDGIEWRRAKWRGAARRFLRFSERMAVRWSNVVIADNPEIARHLHESYGREAEVIAYGGDQALATPPGDITDLGLPERYALALARAEPENNLATILQAFAAQSEPLVVASNWSDTDHGRNLRRQFGAIPHLHLIDAEYEPARLRAIRERAWLYVHGHSAGGTNPVLVEMMQFGVPIAAYDCAFNRETTGGGGAFFDDAESLAASVAALSDPRLAHSMGTKLADFGRRSYRWRNVTDAYFRLFGV